MQTTATNLDVDVLPDHPMRHRIDMVRRVGVFNSRADATARAALIICGLETKFGHMGRGPELYDDFGLVLASLQAGWDMAGWPSAGRSLPDLPPYTPSPYHGLRANEIGDHLAAIGLDQVVCRAPEISRNVRPGDIVTYNGRVGAGCGVCVEGPRVRSRGEPVDTRCNDSWPLFALVFPDQKPRATRACFMNTTPARLYRWPQIPTAGEGA